MNSSVPKLYCAWFCPFAQRAWIALEHKGIKFDYMEQDPYNKSPEWLAINPKGLVPAIVHNGKTIADSYICIEYIEDVWPQGPHLLPKDPYQKAVARTWGDHVTKKIVPPFYGLLMGKHPDGVEQLLKGLGTLVDAMDEAGPFICGPDFSFADIMLLPYAIRFDILKHFKGFEIPKEPRFERFQTWFQACMKLECVQKTLPDMGKLMQKYERYDTDTADTEVATAIRNKTALP